MKNTAEEFTNTRYLLVTPFVEIEETMMTKKKTATLTSTPGLVSTAGLLKSILDGAFQIRTYTFLLY